MRNFVLTAIAVCISLCASVSISSHAQMVVSGSHLQDSSGNLITNSTIIFAPVNNNGVSISYRVAGSQSGQAVSRSVTAQVTNGAFTLSLPDTSRTNPANVCFSVNVKNNVSGVSLLGAGYNCVQPSSAPSQSYWCSSTTCDFDNYVPSTPQLTATTAGPVGPAPVIQTGTTTVGTNANDYAVTVTPTSIAGTYNLNVKVPLAPSATDTTKLPLTGGTMTGALNVPSINSTYYVDPTSETAVNDQIVSLITQCGSNPCEIHIPSGTYTANPATTINITQPGISIEGAGKTNTVINFAGTTFLNSNEGANFTLAMAGKVSGFTVDCSATNAVCFKAGSIIGYDISDVIVIGADGLTSQGSGCNGSTGFQFQNTGTSSSWMERWAIHDSEIGGFCTNIHFMSPQNSGTDSFAYGLVDGLWTGQGAGSKNIVVDSGASPYNLLGWKMNVNSSGTTTADEVFDVAGTFSGVGFSVTAENAGAPITFCHLLSGGSFIFEGAYRTFGNSGCNLDTGAGIFQIDSSSLQGVESNSSVAGKIQNFGGSTQTADILWGTRFNATNPAERATIAWARSETPNALSGVPTSPFFVYDPDLPFCSGKLEGSSYTLNASNAVPTDCIDTNGQHFRPYRDPNNVLSWDGSGSYGETTYNTEVQAPDGSYRFFGNADFVDEGDQASRVVGHLSCRSMTLPDVGHGDTEQARICWGPDDANSFSTKARLYLQVNTGGAWQTSLLLTPTSAVFSQPLTAPSIAPANGFSGTKTAGSCVLTIVSGIITNVTGC